MYKRESTNTKTKISISSMETKISISSTEDIDKDREEKNFCITRVYLDGIPIVTYHGQLGSEIIKSIEANRNGRDRFKKIEIRYIYVNWELEKNNKDILYHILVSKYGNDTVY